MAETVASLLSVLKGRVRDPQATATPNDQMRRLLSESQRAWNCFQGDVVSELTLTVAPMTLVHQIEPLLPTCARVIAVRDANGRDLDRCPFSDIQHVSHRWFRQTGVRFEQWSLIGRDMLVLYPALTQVATVTVVAHTLTADLASDLDETEVTDDELPTVLDLAEILVHLRNRRLNLATPIVERMTAHVKAEG